MGTASSTTLRMRISVPVGQGRLATDQAAHRELSEPSVAKSILMPGRPDFSRTAGRTTSTEHGENRTTALAVRSLGGLERRVLGQLALDSLLQFS